MYPQKITITVATVTWNAEAVIERTLHSVEEQDYPRVEHIIVDGNSSDKTREMALNYQERNNRPEHSAHKVIVISEPDEGLYDAMNKALRVATGQYIVFLNAGDKFHSADTLSHIADAAGDNVGVIYGDTDIVDDKGNFLRKRHLRPPAHLTWKSFRKGMLVCHQAFFARTDIAKSQPYNLSYRFSADYEWCIRVMKEAEAGSQHLQNAGIVVADYLDGGMTVQNHRSSLKERFKAMKNHYGLLTAVAMHFSFIGRALMRRLKR